MRLIDFPNLCLFYMTPCKKRTIFMKIIPAGLMYMRKYAVLLKKATCRKDKDSFATDKNS